MVKVVTDDEEESTAEPETPVPDYTAGMSPEQQAAIANLEFRSRHG